MLSLNHIAKVPKKHNLLQRELKEELENLNADNEKILNQASAEKEAMLKEAREIKSKLIADAEDEAKNKSEKMVDAAKTAIEN